MPDPHYPAHTPLEPQKIDSVLPAFSNSARSLFLLYASSAVAGRFILVNPSLIKSPWQHRLSHPQLARCTDGRRQHPARHPTPDPISTAPPAAAAGIRSHTEKLSTARRTTSTRWPLLVRLSPHRRLRPLQGHSPHPQSIFVQCGSTSGRWRSKAAAQSSHHYSLAQINLVSCSSLGINKSIKNMRSNPWLI